MNHLMNRRLFGQSIAISASAAWTSGLRAAEPSPSASIAYVPGSPIVPLVLSDAQWKARLSEVQYLVLRKEGTERPGSSPLNNEKRKGRYLCAACQLPLFDSSAKYDSGTGWPSFHTSLPDALGMKTDFKLVYPRTEYHCIRCGGHQGHVFNDGPKPSGKRYCNNGVALTFVANPST